MRILLIALLFLISCSKDTPAPAKPAKTCYPVTGKYFDQITLKHYIMYNGGVNIEVSGTTYNQITDQICFDNTGKVVF